MSLPITKLTRDVSKIYSNEYKTTKTYTKEYEFLDNKVTIVFERVWKGEAYVCGVDMYGSAKVTMQSRDSALEKKISDIIQQPKYLTVVGEFPVVGYISFN